MAATDRMRTGARRGGRERGFSMIEVLVSLLIIQVGLLGLVGTQVVAQRAEAEAYQRAQALILLNDMVERINSNRGTASCFAFTDPTTGTPYLGGSSSTDPGRYTPACATGSYFAMVNNVLDGWDRELLGSAERDSSNNKIGAILSARGCVSSYTDTSNVASGVTVYVITVAWQGQTDSFSPTAMAAAAPSNTALQKAATCGVGLYGSDDGLRRIVYDTVQIASLN